MESTITTKKYQSLSKGLGTAGIILGIMTLLFSILAGIGTAISLMQFAALG